MMSPKMVDALNQQINREMYSAYLYMAMSADATTQGLKGFANWFYVQYQEEMVHAMKIYAYLHDQNQRVVLQAIEQPPTEFGKPLEMFQATLKHEQYITQSINDLMDLAIELRDHATQIFLQWYVTEQIEEEGNDNAIIDQLKMIGDGHGLFMIDKELAARVFVPPAAGTGA